MELVRFKQDVWGREVLLGTGVLPILGVKFPWLTLHWVAGLVLTAAVAFHIVRSLASKDRFAMHIRLGDLRELTSQNSLPGKYSLAQKSMHAAMTVLVLTTIVTGLVLFALMDTPWWVRSNFLSEAALGWTFLLHGAATLALLGLAALHLYFAMRPEKRFYTHAMLKGWASEGELRANHDLGRWRPAPHPQPAAGDAGVAPAAQQEHSRPARVAWTMIRKAQVPKPATSWKPCRRPLTPLDPSWTPRLRLSISWCMKTSTRPRPSSPWC